MTASTFPESEEREFIFNGFRYVAQCWGEDGGLPVLAVHGWLDNSASFNILAPQLKGVQFVALDLAGHGYSDHRIGLSDYPIWSETAEIYAVADAMGWDQFALIGHSRGAMISTLASAVFPERISHLILLDALTPPPVSPDNSPERMVKSIQEIHRRLKRERSCYPTYEAAIKARCQSEFGKVSEASAELLASRGLTQFPEGYNWHADGKLWAPSNVALTAEQIESFVDNIKAKTLVLLGEHGLKSTMVSGSPFERMLLKMVSELNTEIQEFDDGHYLHMESAAEDVAAAIQAFLFKS
ncbi:MAG: alpha/beta fold hydrolase [Cellvibrionaceae bacterium]